MDSEEMLANLSSKIDELERKIEVELSAERKEAIMLEINELGMENREMFSIYKMTRLTQHTNYCNSLILERQTLLLQLITQTTNQNELQRILATIQPNSTNNSRSNFEILFENILKFYFSVWKGTCFPVSWDYANIIRTTTLAVNSIGIILATIYNSIQINKKHN